MASERATELADDFAAANLEVIAFVEACTDAQWDVVVPGEEWTVGVLVHHVAESYALSSRWLRTMASGAPVTDTGSDLDEANAEHARRVAGVTRAQVLSLLAEDGALLEAELRALTDEELDRTATFGPAGGRPLPTAQLAAVAARHPREHVAHARAALENPGGSSEARRS